MAADEFPFVAPAVYSLEPSVDVEVSHPAGGELSFWVVLDHGTSAVGITTSTVSRQDNKEVTGHGVSMV